LRYFSMFSGIGGFELGIQNAYRGQNRRGKEDSQRNENERKGLVSETGGSVSPQEGQSGQHVNDGERGCEPACAGYSEIDKYAIQIYQRHFPGHQNHGDAAKIRWENVPGFDFLIGGFPCQTFSIAGRRMGFDDTRGTMFFEIARCLREKQPCHFLLENVKGLLSHGQGRTFAVILSTLDELGYDCQWQVLNSKNFGVPQNRERVFIIGCLRGKGRREIFPIRENPTKTQIELLGTTKGEECTRFGERDVVMSKEGLCGALKATDYKQPPQLLELTSGQKQGYRVYDPDGISATLVGQAGGVGAKTGLYNVGVRVRRLTPTECERLQGFPDGWTEHGVNQEGKETKISDSQRYKVLGNAVTVNVIEAVVMKLMEANHEQSV